MSRYDEGGSDGKLHCCFVVEICVDLQLAVIQIVIS